MGYWRGREGQGGGVEEGGESTLARPSVRVNDRVGGGGGGIGNEGVLWRTMIRVGVMSRDLPRPYLVCGPRRTL